MTGRTTRDRTGGHKLMACVRRCKTSMVDVHLVRRRCATASDGAANPDAVRGAPRIMHRSPGVRCVA